MNEEIRIKIIEFYEEVIGDEIKNINGQYSLSRKLNSLEVMQIVVAIEDDFGIEFNGDELDYELFADIDKIVDIVSKKLDEE